MTVNAVVCNFDGDQAQMCEQNATFEFPFQWLDANDVATDFSGYTAKMQVKDGSGNVIIELSTANSRITTDSNATTMTLYISASDTGDLEPGKYTYDLFLIETADTESSIKLLKGVFEVEKAVTAV